MILGPAKKSLFKTIVGSRIEDIRCVSKRNPVVLLYEGTGPQSPDIKPFSTKNALLLLFFTKVTV
jgi:hypothetical protein